MELDSLLQEQLRTPPAQEPTVTILGDLGHDYIYTCPPLEGGREVIIRSYQRTLAGAAGYVLKECAGRELIDAIRAVMAGQKYLSPSITAQIVDVFKRLTPAAPHPEAACLTPAELRVLRLLTEGRSNKETAIRLDVSVKTVENHRASIMAKLGMHSIVELTKFAIRTGLITLDK